MVGLTHIGLSGSRGRMGRAVSSVLDNQKDVVVATRFDRGAIPDLSSCDVVIDFTAPEASLELARTSAAAQGPALVIGSTGFMPEQDDLIESYAKQITIVRSGNFSLGVNMLQGLVAQAARRLSAQDWDVEIIEAHHGQKRDAPSGTALMLGEAAAAGRGQDLEDVRADPRDGIGEVRQTGEIGFSSIRAGGIIGEHQVIFAAQDEILTLAHSARDRALFARGAVIAALWAKDRSAGLYNMQDVLGFRQA